MVMSLFSPAAVMTAIVVLLFLDDDHVAMPTVPAVVPGVCGRAAGKRHAQSHHGECDKREYDFFHGFPSGGCLVQANAYPACFVPAVTV
jgi:hypothetical protein